ncbi:MAG: hypothetical protein V7719_08165 [Psychroserpens sp.]
MTSILIGAIYKEQLKENMKALDNIDFSTEELTQIDSASCYYYDK